MKATVEEINHILKILDKDNIYSHSVIDFDKENDVGYEDYNDQIYIDGVVTFDTMAEIVDYLREQMITKQETLPILSKQIKDCGLSVRATNICLANELYTVADLVKITSAEWLKFRNGGYKSLKEIEVFLKDNGLHLGMEV